MCGHGKPRPVVTRDRFYFPRERGWSISVGRGCFWRIALPTEDTEIRDAGFVISDRPNKGPAIWRRGRKLYEHKDALKVSRKEKPARDQAAELADLEARKRGKR